MLPEKGQRLRILEYLYENRGRRYIDWPEIQEELRGRNIMSDLDYLRDSGMVEYYQDPDLDPSTRSWSFEVRITAKGIDEIESRGDATPSAQLKAKTQSSIEVHTPNSGHETRKYVFVSHSSKDTALMSTIKHAFVDLSIAPHFVEEKPSGAPPTRELADAVRKSKALFVFFTSNSISLETRDWIVFELGVAVAHGIPIYCWKQSSLNKFQLPRLLEQVTTYRDFEIYNSESTIRLTEEVRAAAKSLDVH